MGMIFTSDINFCSNSRIAARLFNGVLHELLQLATSLETASSRAAMRAGGGAA